MPAKVAAADVPDDEAKFELFLGRLGLVELQILHGEQCLDRASGEEQRNRIALHLADLYAAELIASASDKAKYASILRRIEQLVAKIPSARTAALEVMLLQADYQRAEQLIASGDASDNSAARQEAASLLVRIAGPLEQRRGELQARVEKMQTEIDAMPDGDARSALEVELSRCQSLAGRATYFAAWSNYYAARISGQSDVKARFEKSRDLFRGIVGIDTNDASVQAASLGLESVWRARSLVGLGLCEAALGNAEGSKLCFDLIEHSSVAPEVRELAPYWRLESLLAAGRYDVALKYAQERVSAFSGGATQGKVSFCVSLVRAAYANRSNPPRQAQEFARLGLTGLVKLRQMRAVRDLLEKYPVDLNAAGGFYLRWAKGEGLFERAERSHAQADYRAAAREFETALATEEAKQDLAASAHCGYLLAWCLYRVGEFENAAKGFQQSVAGLQAAKRDTAVESAWMAFVSCAALAKQQPKFNAAAIAALELVKREFPDHPYAKRADYYLGKFQTQMLSSEESLARLDAVAPGSPNYLDARYDICLARYGQWREASGDARQASGDLTLAAVDKYLAAAAQDRDVSRKVKVCLIGADLASQRSDASRSRKYLDAAQSWLSELPAKSELAAEYHYRRLQDAGGDSRSATVKEHVEWLINHATGTAFEVPGLIAAARTAEEAVKSASAANKTRAQEEAYRIYQRLSERLGNEPQRLQQEKNAQVAQSKAAAYAFQLGRYDEAAQGLQRLIAAFPDNRDYLRRAGLAHFQAGDHKSSLDAWRTLLAGLDKNSDGWFEAKYYQLACLFRIDSTRAKPVWEQFKLLHPQLGPPEWRARFQEFDRRG